MTYLGPHDAKIERLIREEFMQQSYPIPAEHRLEHDPVNRPAHYTRGQIEVIDFIEDQGLPYHLACALKYICRCRFKGAEIQDVEKAVWYLNRYIGLRK